MFYGSAGPLSADQETFPESFHRPRKAAACHPDGEAEKPASERIGTHSLSEPKVCRGIQETAKGSEREQNSVGPG